VADRQKTQTFRQEGKQLGVLAAVRQQEDRLQEIRLQEDRLQEDRLLEERR
jgi:hypothetical protein